MMPEIFQKKFNTAIVLMIIPVLINLAVSAYCFMRLGDAEFRGYVAGTILSMTFSLIWVFMVKRVSFSNPMVLFALSLGSFPIKIVVFAVFAFGGLFVLKMNNTFFGIAFLFGTVISLFVEVWFVTIVNKIIREAKYKK